MTGPKNCTMRMAILAALLGAGMNTAAMAQEAGTPVVEGSLGWGVEMQMASAYIWRGRVDIDAANVQPSFWLDTGFLTATSWMSATTDGIQEHDASVAFEGALGRLTAAGGWINYYYFESIEPRVANDLFASLEYRGRVSPSIAIFQPIGGDTPIYAEAATEMLVPVGGAWSVAPRLAVGYTAAAPDAPASLTHIEQTVTLEWSRSRLQVRPFVSYVRSVGRSAATTRRAYAGVAISRR